RPLRGRGYGPGGRVTDGSARSPQADDRPNVVGGGLASCEAGDSPAVAIATRNGTSSNYLQRGPSPSGLADVLDIILDKGLVIDAYVRVSVVGIEVLTIDARIVRADERRVVRGGGGLK